MRHVLFFALLTVLLLQSGGCAGGYVLRGRVIEGTPTGAHYVPAAELRDNAPGVARARINIYRDPYRLNQTLVASGLSGPDGTFAIPLDAFGAGWMEETWMVEASHGQFQSAETIVRLPADSNRTQLLILLAPGRGAAPSGGREDLMEEYRRYR